MQKKHIQKICICAIMSAFYVALDFLAVAVSSPFGGTMKISISGLPVIIAAVMFGPLWGAATGFIGAFIGQLITYGFGPTTLLWVLPAVIRGLSVGIMFKATKGSLKPLNLCIITVISALLVTAVNSVVMYIDSIVFSYPIVIVGVALINRIVVGIITAIVFALILPPILKAMNRIIKK